MYFSWGEFTDRLETNIVVEETSTKGLLNNMGRFLTIKIHVQFFLGLNAFCVGGRPLMLVFVV